MSVAPENVARVTPPRGSDHDLAINRDHTTGAGLLTAADLSATETGRRGMWMGHTMIVGEPARHGTVADEAAMLALHDWADDPHTRTLYHYVQVGDSVLREDDPGYYWVCIGGHGTMLSQWERRPLGDTVADAIDLLATKIGSSALEGYLTEADAATTYQPLLANRTSLARIGESAGAPTWNGGAWPSTGGGSGGGMDLTLGLKHWITGRESDHAALDLVTEDTWTWTGTAATAAGKLTRALSFGGANYISRQMSGSRVFSDGFTRVCWLKPTGTLSAQFLSCFGVFPGGFIAYQYQSLYSSVYRMAGSVSSTGTSDMSGIANESDPLTVGSWVFIAQGWDPLGRAWSYNFVGGPSGAMVKPFKLYDTADPMVYIGAGGPSQGAYNLKADVDSYAIWTRSLSPQEIVWLWNSGTGRLFSEL